MKLMLMPMSTLISVNVKRSMLMLINFTFFGKTVTYLLLLSAGNTKK